MNEDMERHVRKPLRILVTETVPPGSAHVLSRDTWGMHPFEITLLWRTDLARNNKYRLGIKFVPLDSDKEAQKYLPELDPEAADWLSRNRIRGLLESPTAKKRRERRAAKKERKRRRHGRRLP